MPKRKRAEEPYFPPEGGQGMLARPAHWMTAQERYPRGYTPQRQREVSEALNGVQFRASNADLFVGYTAARREEDFVRQAITRSTIPVAQLRGLQKVVPTSGAVADTSLAHYKFGNSYSDGRIEPMAHLHIKDPIDSKSEYVVPNTDTPQSPNDVSRSIIHELGHHVQNLPYLDRGRPYRPRTSFTSRVRDEADAENFADQHHVDDPRFPPSEEIHGGYDRTLIAHVSGSEPLDSYGKKWAREYRKHRLLNLDQFKKAPKGRAPGRRDPGEGQMSLFEQAPSHEQLRLL